MRNHPVQSLAPNYIHSLNPDGYKRLLLRNYLRNIRCALMIMCHGNYNQSWPLIAHLLDCFSFAAPWGLFKRCSHCRTKMIHRLWDVYSCPNCYLTRRGKYDTPPV